MKSLEFPSVESFRAFCEESGWSAAAGKTYRSGYRRIIRDLRISDLSDSAVMTQYRVSLKQGTRNVFDTTYKIVCDFMAANGMVLPEGASMPRIRFSHPLMHDVMTLTGYLNVSQLASLTWGTIPEHAIDDSVERSLERIYEFQTGRAGMTATADTPLIPVQSREPMREWQIEYIVNSLHHETEHIVDRSAKKLSEVLVHAKVNGLVLRDYMTAYWHARPTLVRALYHEESVKEILSMAREGNLTTLRRILADKASKMAGEVWW